MGVKVVGRFDGPGARPTERGRAFTVCRLDILGAKEAGRQGKYRRSIPRIDERYSGFIEVFAITRNHSQAMMCGGCGNH